MVGSLTFGLAQLLLADHEGRRDWRDAAGLGFGALAVMSSGVGITMVGIVGLTLLLRRGWRVAALHVLPLAGLFVAWAVVANPSTGSELGRPGAGRTFQWVRITVTATFEGIGGWPVVGAALALVTVVGLVLAYGPGRRGSLLEAVRRTAAPLAMFAGSLAMAAITAQGRWFAGDELARSERYVHLGAALTLPLIGVAGEAIVVRWRHATAAVVALLLVAVPFGWQNFDQEPFGSKYMRDRARILTTAVRMPFVDGVDQDVQPVPDPYAGDGVTLAFLRSAERVGALDPSTEPLTPWIENEFRIRLGLMGHAPTWFPSADDCTVIAEQSTLAVDEGDRFTVSAPLRVATRSGDEQTGPWVVIDPTRAGAEQAVELPHLDLFVAPWANGPATLCMLPRR